MSGYPTGRTGDRGDQKKFYVQKFYVPSLSGLQKGPAERGHVKNVKNRQKVSKSFSTLFDDFRAGQKTSKIVKKCQKVFRHFSTIFARHLFSGPFCNPLILCSLIFFFSLSLSLSLSLLSLLMSSRLGRPCWPDGPTARMA